MSSLSILLRRLDDLLSRLSLLTRDLPLQATDAISVALKTELASRILADLPAIQKVQSSLDAAYSRMAPTGVPEPLSVDGFTRDEARLGLIRLLVRAQALALDRTPAERVEVKKKAIGELKDDKGITALLASETANRGLSEIGDSDLQQRCEAALQPLGSSDLNVRLQRFLDIHRLILDIARAETVPVAAAAEERKIGAPS